MTPIAKEPADGWYNQFKERLHGKRSPPMLCAYNLASGVMLVAGFETTRS